MEEKLYLVQWTEEHDDPTAIGIEIEEVREIVASDHDCFLVRSYDTGTLERIVSKYPGWSMSGQPAEGEFTDIGGAEFTVRDGALVD
jgi:hypothetical protein